MVMSVKKAETGEEREPHKKRSEMTEEEKQADNKARKKPTNSSSKTPDQTKLMAFGKRSFRSKSFAVTFSMLFQGALLKI